MQKTMALITNANIDLVMPVSSSFRNKNDSNIKASVSAKNNMV